MKIDLNCDMGELEDAAHEAALMEHITSANIACGGHAGDEATMERTARLALERGVRIGAHPGYPDRANFGRIEMPMSAAEIEDYGAAADRTAGRRGAPPGRRDRAREAARRAVQRRGAQRGRGARHRRWIAQWNPGNHGLRTGRVAHARLVAGHGPSQPPPKVSPTAAMSPTARCVLRKFPDALITDPAAAAAQALRLAHEGVAQTICVHGDTPGAVNILKACREALR